VVRSYSIQSSYILGFSFVYQALAIVGIIAPNSLTAGFELTRRVNTQVPLLDLSKQTSFLLSDTVQKLIGQLTWVSVEEMWTVPPECSTACVFQIEYEAPALSCTNKKEGDLLLKPYQEGTSDWVYYLSTIHLDGTESPDQDVTWGQRNSLNFTVDYIPQKMRIEPSGPPQISQQPVQGVFCFFLDGKYRAEFRHSDHKSTIKTALISYGNSFEDGCQWSSGVYPSSGCRYYATHAITISEAMINGFAGSASWTCPPDGNGTESYFRPEGLGLFRTTFDYQENTTGDGTYSLTPKFHNISAALTEVFANITIGLALQLGQTNSSSVLTSDGVLVWEYNPTILWAIYGGSFLISVLIAIYGLFCIHSNGIAMEKKFSTFMISTRTQELDEIYEGMESRETLLRIRMRYDKTKGKFVVRESPREERIELMEQT
jgi:hypothetical protein